MTSAHPQNLSLSYDNVTMQSFIRHIVVCLLILSSLEAAADIIVDSFLHGDNTVHEEEFGHQLDVHDEGSSDSEVDDEHCRHCCHGHGVGLAVLASPSSFVFNTNDKRLYRGPNVPALAQAPPTPPPNA